MRDSVIRTHEESQSAWHTAYLLEAARANSHDFELLAKPVHPAELLERIRELTEPVSLLPAQRVQT
ncbi:hypothetical protein SBA5_920015 [Candidatus Sulfotelmatomonas gaucii]|uniref:Uncharacterized protein n=1 Tax=Candidatus Sulfuritelmatomonas gaucii TaxID=2043161 RepID=A0A2N9M959_9BACT|nr:hypothetical protein SBA5_920015 [Candidatus Sulfotelmatomonas gaucii]